MTAATTRALELYPEPEAWQPANGLADKDRTEANLRQVFLRSTLLSDEWPRMIRALRTVMGLRIPAEPTPLTPAQKEHHGKLLYSEVGEMLEASDVIDQADGFLDVIVVALGGLVELGLTDNQILAGFSEVHCSNMTKVQDDGSPLINDGVIRPDEPIGKFLKTNNYIRPDLAGAMSITEPVNATDA